MNAKKLLVGVMIFSTMLAGRAIAAEPVAPVDPAQAKAQAMAIVDRMAGLLAGAKSLSVTMDTGFDAVQASGQKIEFGEMRKIVADRPAHLLVEATSRDGKKSRVSFDGKDLTLYYEQSNVYASDPKAGTVDDAVKYFTEDLGMRMPLAVMLSTKLKDFLDREVREAAFVEESFIAGVACDHLALRGDHTDMQLWIAKGDQPLPQRVVITYKELPERPQFWAQFSNWNLAPEVSDALFAFNPPQGAKKIPFSPRQVMPSGQKDAKKEEVKP